MPVKIPAMQLSIVIVSFNVRYFLEQCLLSVEKAGQGLAMEVFVVDNASSDGSAEMVAQRFPSVSLIANDKNLGFAKANNQAIRQAKGEFILLLNPDTLVQVQTFHICLDFMALHPQCGGLGVRMVDGTGKFLPESKRGFPSPFVACCKIVGISALFPRSRLFNRYHLGYLPNDQTHEIEVLSGAFMFLRHAALHKTGLLDEAFFMYGEDIDLSYRLLQAGYKNYYLPSTSIIHYKGESTKKDGKYVRVFYNAMSIFAQKHFKGQDAIYYLAFINAAIGLSSALSLLKNTLKPLLLPLADGLLFWGGLWLLKDFWAAYYYENPNYYNNGQIFINFSFYTFSWLLGIFLSGGYDQPSDLGRLLRGILAGSLLVAVAYGLMPESLRFSRAIILMGTLWVIFAALSTRLFRHVLVYGNFNFFTKKAIRLLIVGSKEECQKAMKMLAQLHLGEQCVGAVSPQPEADSFFLGKLADIVPIARAHQANEILFCAQDLGTEDVINTMGKLGTGFRYKIAMGAMAGIVGSHSKNKPGEVYVADIYFNIGMPLQRRNKRMFDLLSSMFLILLFIFFVFFVKKQKNIFKSAWQVLLGRKTWVGYALPVEAALPMLKPSVLTIANGLSLEASTDAELLQSLNLQYAKAYSIYTDWEMLTKWLFATPR
jgi:GT2 family glycosyltransferase